MTTKILVVEDNPVIAKLLSEILKKHHYDVQTVNDGLKALNILESYVPDIIITDLLIPKINGEMLCRIIRAKERFASTHLIILSGIVAEAGLDTSRLGIDACIAKGKNMREHLLEVLDKIKNGQLRHDRHEQENYGFEDTSSRDAILELLDSRNHLEVILTNLFDGLVEITGEGTIIFANPAAARYLSTAVNDLLGNNFFSLFAGDHRDYTVSLHTEACRDTAAIRESESLPFGDRYLTLKICPLATSPQPPCVVIIHDVTRRRLMEQQLKRLSTTDQLTGAYNRRAFEDFFHNESNRATRYDKPLSLIFLDIDHFKKINDLHGHDAGDRILQDLVHLINGHKRQYDYLCRWGGEEFVILLPETDSQGAHISAERLRSTIEVHSFPIPSQVTVSIGVSQFLSDDTSASLLKRADTALYQAKHEGRNQVRVAG